MMTMPKNTLHQKSLLTGKLYTWSCLFLKDFTYSKMAPIVGFHCKYKSFRPAKEKYHEKQTYFSFPATPVAASRASQ